MLISLNMLRDFVNVPELPAQELAQKITLAVAEVEGVHTLGAIFEKIKVAQILSIRKHPEADKLNLVTLNLGEASPLELVCGASNVREGLKIAFAPIGVTLPNGLTLEAKKIRGFLSQGMICSQAELGLAKESSGIWELSEVAVVGQTLLQHLNFKADVLFDIDNKSLTHRPDLWGHFGMAREMSALFNAPLKNPFDENWQKKIKQSIPASSAPIKVKLEKDCAGLAYFGLSIEGVNVAESPQWLKERLTNLGLKSINNIVDVSNYVMVELGIPLHIFDRDLIEGDVHIKKLGKDENFTTLDGQTYELLATDTVIADSKKNLVLAGIMGGLSSSVSPKTKNLFIEVANWKAALVRKTSSRLGLRTESSQRYEKSLDSQLLERTLLRTLELLNQLCPNLKVVGSLQYDGENLSGYKPLVIKTSLPSINAQLGTTLSSKQVTDILQSLDFKITEKDHELLVQIPTYRSTKDMECEADVVEEVGRIIGYDNITPISPLSSIQARTPLAQKNFERKVKDFWVGHGNALEVMTYPLVGEDLLKKTQWKELNEKLKLLNPLSVEADRLRPSLIPSLLQKVELNHKHFSSFRFFEWGRSYSAHAEQFGKEQFQLGIGFYHESKNTFMELTNICEDFFRHLNLPATLEKKEQKNSNNYLSTDWSGTHPHEFFHFKIMGKFQGGVTSLHPLYLRQLKMKGHLSLAILDVTDFWDKPLKNSFKFTPLSIYPSSVFDLGVVVPPQTYAQDVLSIIEKLPMKELTNCKVVNVFSPNEKEKFITLRVVFSDPEKTLSGEFLKQAQTEVIKSLDQAGYPLKLG